MAGVGIDNWILLIICGAGVALGTGFAGWAMKAGIAFGIPVFLATTTDTFGDLTDSFTPVTRFKKKHCSEFSLHLQSSTLKYIIIYMQVVFVINEYQQIEQKVKCYICILASSHNTQQENWG